MMKNSEILALTELVNQTPNYLEDNINMEADAEEAIPAPYIGEKGGEFESAKDLLYG
jgi:hypothetical protein